MGFIDDKLRSTNSIPQQQQPPAYIVCRYCGSQIPVSVAHGDYCSRLCRLRWNAEWQALQKLNSSPKTADALIAEMDKALKRRR
jgi:hypothetical protein